MNKTIPGLAALLALVPLAACRPDADGVVARAAGHDLTVPDAVTLLAGEGFPNEHDVVHTVADLWVDYLLLAHAVARDPELRQIDLSRIVEQQAEQELILAYRDLMVQPDTVVSDEEVERRFARTAAGTRVRARHIFVAYPEAPSASQRDSVHAVARGLLERVRSGESFEQLARDHSDDTGSAREGGDLGWFGHGELQGALEEAAFSLEPGEVSGVVESVFGLHILRVDEKDVPSFEEAVPQVRATIQQERIAAAESALVAGVETGAQLQVVPGAAELVRRIAEDPGMRLSRRARDRPLVRYRGGSFSVGDLVTFMQGRAAQFRFQIHAAPDEAIEENLLVGLAQRKLLVDRAMESGMSVSDARRDTLSQELRERLVQAARELDLVAVTARGGESPGEARERRIEELLRDILRGMQDVLPLGSFSFVLRERYSGQVYAPGVDQVVRRVAVIRGPDPGTPPPGQPGVPSGDPVAPPPDMPLPDPLPDGSP